VKTEYGYIRFVEMPSSGITKRWHCENRRHGHFLGLVRWSGGWRQYVYDSGPAQYSGGCLKDIQDFIEQAMRERKGKT